MEQAHFCLVSGLDHTLQHEVVAFRNESHLNSFIVNAHEAAWYAVSQIDTDTALRLVEEAGGVGAGCYIPDDTRDRLNRDKQACASLRMLDVIRFVGSGVFEQPVSFNDIVCCKNLVPC